MTAPAVLLLSLPIPPSTNDLYERKLGFTKKGRPYRATRLKASVEAYRWRVREAINHQLTADQVRFVPQRMAITILLREDCCRADADNTIKATLDAIKGPLGFDDNPRRVRKVGAEYHNDPELPPCLVKIEAVR